MKVSRCEADKSMGKFQDGKRRARDKLKSIDGGHGGLGEGGGQEPGHGGSDGRAAIAGQECTTRNSGQKWPRVHS